MGVRPLRATRPRSPDPGATSWPSSWITRVFALSRNADVRPPAATAPDDESVVDAAMPIASEEPSESIMIRRGLCRRSSCLVSLLHITPDDMITRIDEKSQRPGSSSRARRGTAGSCRGSGRSCPGATLRPRGALRRRHWRGVELRPRAAVRPLDLRDRVGEAERTGLPDVREVPSARALFGGVRREVCCHGCSLPAGRCRGRAHRHPRDRQDPAA